MDTLADEKKKINLKKLLIICLVIVIVVIGIWAIVPKKVGVAISIPYGRVSDIEVKVNDDIIFDESYTVNESYGVPEPGLEFSKARVSGVSFKVSVKEYESGQEKEETLSIFRGSHIKIVFHDDGIKIIQDRVRTQYE